MAAKKASRKSSARGASKATTGARKARKKPPKRVAPPQPDAEAIAAQDAAPNAAEDIVPADLSALKDGKLYYRIGEVSQITGVKPYVLRYWESEFRLMAPQKSRSKQRLYRQKDIETILAIKRLLYQERYTIAGARRKLRELGSAAREELVAETLEAAAQEAAAVLRIRGDVRRIRDELLNIRQVLAAEA